MIEFANDGEMLTLGKLLKSERERQELTLEEIAEKTKINVKYLKAIEEERKDDFPGELYYDLFCKSYAEALGLEYARIKAGTFAMQDLREESGRTQKKKDEEKPSKETSPKSESKSTEKPKFALQPHDDKSRTELKMDTSGDKPEKKGEGPDMIKILIGIAGVVLCVFIVLVYISLSSGGPNSSDRDRHDMESEVVQEPEESVSEPVTDIHDAPGHEKVVDSSAGEFTGVDPNPEDTIVEGPVEMYPESLEVVLTSSEEFWASVVSDGDTVFKRLVSPDAERFFSAFESLEITLGRWEFITGTIYGKPLKPMSDFHVQGNNAVRLRINKENWESFVDSTKTRNEQD